MIVTPADANYIRQVDTLSLRYQYYEIFGEDFPPFNYDDFQWVGDKCAAAFYIEALEEAIRTGTPFKSKYKPDYDD